MISLNYFAQTFQCIMNPSNTPLFAGCSTQFITRKQYGRPEVSIYLATSPRILSWISYRPCSIHLKNRVSSFDKGTAAQLAMWQPICMSEWSHCRLLLPKVCAGWSYHPGDHLGAPPPFTPAQKCYAVAKNPEMGGSQASATPGVRNLTHPKLVVVVAGTKETAVPSVVQSWIAPSWHQQIQREEYWPLRSDSDFQVTVMLKQRNSNKGQIG